MSEPTISLRDVKERCALGIGPDGPWVLLSRSEQDALVEAVEAAHLAYGWLPQGEPRRNLLAALARFDFDTRAGTRPPRAPAPPWATSSPTEGKVT